VIRKYAHAHAKRQNDQSTVIASLQSARTAIGIVTVCSMHYLWFLVIK